jgi:hypothetical protein
MIRTVTHNTECKGECLEECCRSFLQSHQGHLSKKARSVLRRFVGRSLSMTIAEVSYPGLIEIRGCGDSTAREIMHWIECRSQSYQQAKLVNS